MWWFFGLINVVIVGCYWFYFNEVKEGDDKTKLLLELWWYFSICIICWIGISCYRFYQIR